MPLVIYDKKTLKPELTVGEVPGTMYGLSNKGWIDTELFESWFTNHFLAYAPPSRPLLLLMDGHSSHFSPLFVNSAAEEQIIGFCLPPNSTHKTQPLDKGVFGPLKRSWREECHSYIMNNPGKVITRYQFSMLFGKAWMKSVIPSNIVSGSGSLEYILLTGTRLFPNLQASLPLCVNERDLKTFVYSCTSALSTSS